MSGSTLYRNFVLRDDAVWERAKAFIEANRKAVLLSVSVSEASKPRTRDQNDYARALVREVASNAWVNGRQFSADAWWEFFAREFGPCDEVELPNGEVVKRRRSTTEMSAKAFSEFIDAIRDYAANTLGLELTL
jgi:hypothetical protein